MLGAGAKPEAIVNNQDFIPFRIYEQVVVRSIGGIITQLVGTQERSYKTDMETKDMICGNPQNQIKIHQLQLVEEKTCAFAILYEQQFGRVVLITEQRKGSNTIKNATWLR